MLTPRSLRLTIFHGQAIYVIFLSSALTIWIRAGFFFPSTGRGVSSAMIFLQASCTRARDDLYPDSSKADHVRRLMIGLGMMNSSLKLATLYFHSPDFFIGNSDGPLCLRLSYPTKSCLRIRLVRDGIPLVMGEQEINAFPRGVGISLSPADGNVNGGLPDSGMDPGYSSRRLIRCTSA